MRVQQTGEKVIDKGGVTISWQKHPRWSYILILQICGHVFSKSMYNIQNFRIPPYYDTAGDTVIAWLQKVPATG